LNSRIQPFFGVTDLEFDERVRRLVDDVSRHHLAIAELLQLGEHSVDSLDRYLAGPPQSIPHARSFAVRVLGFIGGSKAEQALRRVLYRHHLGSLDPVAAQSEFVVKNEAVEQLLRSNRVDFADDYFHAFHVDRLPAAARAVGQFRIRAAIPDLLSSLEDDVIGMRAADALRKFGRHAVPALVRTLFEQHTAPGGSQETRVSRRRRILAAVTLGELQEMSALRPLRALMRDPHMLIAAAAALAKYQLDPLRVFSKQARLLVQASLSSEWLLRERCQAAVHTIGAVCVPAAIGMLGVSTLPDLYGVPVEIPEVQKQGLITFILESAECDSLSQESLAFCPASQLIGGLCAVQNRATAGNVAIFFRHTNEDVRSVVAKTLGRLGGSYASKVLVAMLEDRSRQVRVAAHNALLHLGSNATGVIRDELARRHRPLLRSFSLRTRLCFLLCHIQAFSLIGSQDCAPAPSNKNGGVR
jgi:HEAT repeat protein